MNSHKESGINNELRNIWVKKKCDLSMFNGI